MNMITILFFFGKIFHLSEKWFYIINDKGKSLARTGIFAKRSNSFFL